MEFFSRKFEVLEIMMYGSIILSSQTNHDSENNNVKLKKDRKNPIKHPDNFYTMGLEVSFSELVSNTYSECIKQ